jgi:hypothetical protein
MPVLGGEKNHLFKLRKEGTEATEQEDMNELSSEFFSGINWNSRSKGGNTESVKPRLSCRRALRSRLGFQ